MDHIDYFERAKKVIPGGVNSPVRAFNAVGGTPIFMARAEGAYLYDIEDKPYIDYIGSWGPMILGHQHPSVVEAVLNQAKRACSFGTVSTGEVEIAEKLCSIMPTIEKVRFVNSGTEATMSAIRLARGYTSRDKVIKFEGCYHGHHDALLVKAGSGALTLGHPSSPGIPKGTTADTLILDFNDSEQVETAFREFGNEIAGVILEPIPGNMNMIRPDIEFLNTLRRLCTEYAAVLIFDEVMSGFRVAKGGATELFGITPDLITLGKVIGGGLPVGAFGGRTDIMNCLAPVGPVYQAGTLSGNPLAVVAGLAQLTAIEAEGFYDTLSQKTQRFVSGVNALAQQHDYPMHADGLGGMFGLYFTDEKVDSFTAATRADHAAFNRFFHHMLSAGMYFAPSSYEAGFISMAHTSEDIDRTLTHMEGFLNTVGETTQTGA